MTSANENTLAKTRLRSITRIGNTKPMAMSVLRSHLFLAHSSPIGGSRSEEHTSELQSLMRISYAVFCLKKKTTKIHTYILITFTQQSIQYHQIALNTHT